MVQRLGYYIFINIKGDSLDFLLYPVAVEYVKLTHAEG